MHNNSFNQNIHLGVHKQITLHSLFYIRISFKVLLLEVMCWILPFCSRKVMLEDIVHHYIECLLLH